MPDSPIRSQWIPVAAPVNVAGSGGVKGQPCRLGGHILRETAGTAVVVGFYDAVNDVTGTPKFSINVAANSTATPFWCGGESPADGIRLVNGLSMKVTGAGTVEGCVFIAE